MSVPTPRGLPPNAMRADSPPEDPPDVTLRLSGLTVRPNVLLTDSAYILSTSIPIHMPAHTYDHHGCRHVCLAILDRAQLTEYVHQGSIVFGWLVRQRGEAYGAVFSFHVEVVLERYGQTMERSHSLASLLEMIVKGFSLLHCFIEEGVAETVGLYTHQINSGFFREVWPYQLLGCCCAFAERDRDVFSAPCFRRDLLQNM